MHDDTSLKHQFHFLGSVTGHGREQRARLRR